MLSLIKTLARSFRQAETQSSSLSPPVERSIRFQPGSTRWHHFDLKERLGGGAWGEVYRAYDPVLDQDFALKLIADDGNFEEARVLVRLKHPHIVAIYGAHVSDGFIGIWTELLAGKSLDQVVDTIGPLHPREAASIGTDLCSALAEAHRLGILHRDVKAENVMRTAGGRIVLFDFGLGQRAGRQVDEIAGTPLYMAPELLEGCPATPASEIYALGVLLFYLTSGQFPVRNAGTLEELRAAHRRDRASLRDLRPDASDAFVNIVERAISIDPGHRFKTMGKMGGALAPINAGNPQTRRRWMTAGLAVAAATGAGAATRYFWLGHTSRALGSTGSVVYLAGFDNRSGDQSLTAAGELLRLQLSQSASISLLEPARIKARLLEMDKSVADLPSEDLERQIAAREGVRLVIFPSLLPDRSGLSLNMRAVRLGASPDQNALVRTEVFHVASRSHLFDAIADAGRWARTVCGETLKDIEANDRRPEETTTESWPAIEAFVKAEGLASAKPDEAIAQLHLAINRDPDFVLAQMRLGDLLVNTRRVREGYVAWTRAVDLLQTRHVSRREELRIRGMFAEDTGDYATSAQLFAVWMQEYPFDSRPCLYRASSLQALGQFEQALSLLVEAAKRFPQVEFFPSHLAWVRLIMGDLSAARPLIEQRRNAPGGEYADALLGKYFFLKDDFASAESCFTRLSQSAGRSSLGYSLLACLFAEQGRFSEAAKTLQSGIAFDRQKGQFGMCSDKLFSLAHLKLRVGDVEEAVRLAIEACKGEDAPDRVASSGSLLAQAGFPNEAKNLLSRLDVARSWPVIRRAQARILGEMALAEGKWAVARQHFEVCDQLDPSDTPRDYLARLEVVSHGSPAAAFLRLINSRGAVWFRPERYPPGIWTDSLADYAKSEQTRNPAPARQNALRFLRFRAAGEMDQRMQFAKQFADSHRL